MIGYLRTRVRKQPIISLYFESDELKFYSLEARSKKKKKKKKNGDYPTERKRGKKKRKKTTTTTTAQHLPVTLDLHLLELKDMDVIFSVADPGPLMLGVLDRWTPTVNILLTLIAQISFHIELCPIEARYSISLYTTHLSIWLSGFRVLFFSFYFV